MTGPMSKKRHSGVGRLRAEKSREINPFNNLSRIFKFLNLRFRHFNDTAKSNKYLWNGIVLKKS